MPRLALAQALVVALSLVSALVSPVSADDKAAGKKKGWIQLFNGKDLKNWTVKIKGYEAGDNFGNTFRVKDGVLHTPTPDCFLDGITRRTVIALARARGYELVERAIMPEELADTDEVFLTGTAVEVTPVSEIGDYRFEAGEVCRQMIEDYEALVRAHRKEATSAA